MKCTATMCLLLAFVASFSWAGKQKIILRLREPLRAETIKVQVPELTNGRGETRDLETKVELGAQAKTEAPKNQAATLKLNMVVRNAGKNGVQVTLTLPAPGDVEVVMMDFYGKNLATIFSGSLPSGVFPLRPFPIKEGDNNGIKFMTLRLNGKVALKRVITKVR
ncbi:MAG TPA: hypothetical protein VJ385_18615 [Fibrobacteria bacterium]|nr:hypothetical protein [Fibrobacteria bacterium]